MKVQPRVKRRPVAAPDDPAVHPADRPRAASGAKGDAWVVTLAGLDPAPGLAILAFDTGRDSATIVIGGVEGEPPRRHPTHDLALVVHAGSGVLRHGATSETLVAEAYAGPCTLVIPAGTWHAIEPDPGSPAGIAFLTRPGETIDRFALVGPRAEPGLVHLDTLPVSPWPMRPAAVVPVPAVTARVTPPPGSLTEPAASRPARVVPYEPPVGDGYSLPLDTGSDSLFVMTSTGRSWDRAPVDVPVHRHDREDELIVLEEGAEGWLLNGPTEASVQRVPFRGPCVLVMPSGNLHRVVRTDDRVVRSVLVYAHRSGVTAPWAGIVAEMDVGERAA